MQVSRRHLPHRYVVGHPLFVTFRLHGSLPAGRSFVDPQLSSGKAFAAVDRLLDEQRSGPAYLKMRAIAQVVVDAIQKGAPSDYLLHAWVVMPNHVHLLITPQVDAAALMRRIKGSSAREANNLLGRTGKHFWQDESYDRLVRNPAEFERIEGYILRNPVRAGLARSPAEFRWSSVWSG